MNFGFSTFFFTQKPVGDVVDEIIAHGVKTIELAFETAHMQNMDGNFVKRMAELSSCGIDFSIHAPFFETNLGSLYPEIRQFSRKKAKIAIDMAYALGANPVVMHPGYTYWMDKIKDTAEISWKIFIKNMKGLISYAEKKNITIALESIPMQFFFFYDLLEFKRLQELLPGIGMTLDIGHAYIAKVAKKVKDPEAAIIEDLRELGVKNITHVHLHNNKGRRDEHLFPDGNIDIKRIIHFLKDEGYASKVIIESYEIERCGIPSVLEKLKSIFY